MSPQPVHGEQAETRSLVTAIVINGGEARNRPNKTMTVPAQWFAAGAEHTGAVKTRQTVKAGDSIDIWVNKDGSLAGPPHQDCRGRGGGGRISDLVTRGHYRSGVGCRHAGNR